MAYPYLERIEHGVGDCRGNRAVRGFAGTERLQIRPRDDFDLHFRHLAEAEDGIVGPAVAGDALPVEANAFFQHPARRLDRASLDLIDYAVRIDGFADIDGDGQPLDANILGAFDLGDGGAIGAGVLVAGKAQAVTMAGAFGRLPVRASGDRADDVLCPDIPEITQPQRDGILAAFG